MKVQRLDSVHFNHTVCASRNKKSDKIDNISYNTYPNNYYTYSTPSFKATNVELISKMEAALKEGKLQEVMNFFEQMSDKAKQNVINLVEKYAFYGLTLENYLPVCVKQPSLFYQSPKTVTGHIDIIRFSHSNKYGEVDNEKFWSTILKNPIKLACSNGLLLTEGLI